MKCSGKNGQLQGALAIAGLWFDAAERFLSGSWRYLDALVVALITSIAKEYERISHHGVRETLLEAQADAIGLPLHKIHLPSGSSHPCTNSVYEDIMEEVMLKFRDAGIRTVAFGDIFLEDLRAYRERNLAKVDMRALFPIWKRATSELAATFIESGFRAYLSCVN